ncbi:uncharacterized protein BKA55DRAFT_682213 [Fusarium redolens]|uniref:Uncharacterized protein n=1 Tax=Fusarium redolens TaxID=48865 RepID=A0A9P9R7X6_FUSRE|nr:uncharacterized protein BKA55DRAFT_682213 [Fusarium redolens]KAH7269122.1 hypothetical protein BKA55DRAFT_682213 [Fusarium redolens]
MGGYRIRDSSNKEYAFRSAELYELVKRKMALLPKISIDDLNDWSDADGFVKGLALFQSTYSLVMAFSRLHQGLHLTTLEVETIPLIFATWWAYFFWWKKPVNIQCRTLVQCEELEPNTLADIAHELSKPANCDSNSYWWRPVPRELHQVGWDFYWFESRLEFSSGKLKSP